MEVSRQAYQPDSNSLMIREFLAETYAAFGIVLLGALLV
jgi:hypothetical protein